jgi:uncharacterized protein RhaS with RHS repeats
MYMRNRYYDPASGRFTQPDPIGLAGGMNLYGYASGDPINNSDPFGLMTLEIVGEKLQKAVDELRKNNPAADSAFRALEESKDHFVLFDSDEANCDVCIGAGWAFDSQDAIGLPGMVGERFSGARGVAHIRPSHSNTRRDGIGAIAWHESVHLTGIVRRNQKYSHCEPAFAGVPNGCPRSP